MSWGYGTLATEVYDLDKPVGTSFGDVEFYTRLLSGIEGRVLEPAVGTGRILIPLLEAGFTVDGYDSSPEMLVVCRERCSERGLEPLIREAEMSAFVAAEVYSAVIVPAGSITLLCGRDALARALKGFRECLGPGGHLTVDVPAPQLLRGSDPMRSWSAGPFIWTLQTMHVEYDAVVNQTTRWLRYEKWRDSALVATELQPFRLQHWSIAEFETLLNECRFVEVEVIGDYQAGRAPGAETRIWTFHARRA